MPIVCVTDKLPAGIRYTDDTKDFIVTYGMNVHPVLLSHCVVNIQCGSGVPGVLVKLIAD